MRGVLGQQAYRRAAFVLGLRELQQLGVEHAAAIEHQAQHVSGDGHALAGRGRAGLRLHRRLAGAPGTWALGMLPGSRPERSVRRPGPTWSSVPGGAAFSRLHSIHSSTATISQAKMRNTRVWFISGQARRGRDAMPARSKKELRCHQAAALCRPRPARAMHAGDAAGAGRPGGSRRCWRNAQHYGPRRRSRLAGFRYVSDAGCRAGRA